MRKVHLLKVPTITQGRRASRRASINGHGRSVHRETVGASLLLMVGFPHPIFTRGHPFAPRTQDDTWISICWASRPD